MKKLIFLIIIVIAAAIPAVPYYIGTTVEETFRIEHEEAAQDAALSGFNIELVDYQRGLLNATATSRISIIVPDDKETISLEMRHKISHVPQLDNQVIATVDTELVLSDAVAATLDQLFKGQTPLSINTRIFLDGHQEGTFHSPSTRGQLSGKETIAIEWEGLSGTAWQSPTRDNITFNIHTPGITASPIKDEPVADNAEEAVIVPANVTDSAEAESVSVKELRYKGEMQRGESGMWQGKAEGSISTVSVNVKNKAMPLTMLINSIILKGEQSENNGLINANGALTANSINVNGFLLSNAVYDITVENIDADAMLAWQQTTAKMMKGEVNPENPLEPMFEHIPTLFNAQPVIKFNDISVDSSMGRFAIKMDTRINGKWDEVMLQNPAMIVPMIRVELHANLPRAIVVSTLQSQIRSTILRQAALSETEMTAEKVEGAVNQTMQQQLGGMIAQGFIKENATQLETHIEFNAGQLTVNGMDASPMIGMLMQ